jgi:hypothetical protein
MMRRNNFGFTIQGKSYEPRAVRLFGVLWLITLFGFFASLIFKLFGLLCICLLVQTVSGLYLAFALTSVGKKRFVFLPIAMLFAFLMYKHIPDIPRYLSHDYATAEGFPTNYRTTSSKGVTHLVITLNNQEFTLPDNTPRGRWYIIHYLPHSNFMVDYKVMSREETIEQMKRHGLYK